jgi:hypothetical protein
MQDEAAPWSWRAPLALAVSEMIYLTRVFEGFLEVSMRDRMERTNQTKSDHSVAVDSDQTASNSATKHSKKPGML